jgi:DNA-binding XRE family transcriptional regulator
MVGSLYWTPERVKALRKRAGLTQEAMAHLLCVAPRTLVRWEGGKRAPTGLYVKVLDSFRDHWDRVREFKGCRTLLRLFCAPIGGPAQARL